MRVTGFGTWSGERLAEFVADLEEVADPTEPFATLDAARAEVERRARKNATDHGTAIPDVADDVQNPAPKPPSKGRDPMTDSIPTPCHEDFPNLVEDIAWIEAERERQRERQREMNDRLDRNYEQRKARREALAAAELGVVAMNDVAVTQETIDKAAAYTAMAELKQESEDHRIPEGFDFETDTPGLYVRYKPLSEWPGMPNADGVRNVEVSAFERVFPDGTSDRIVHLVAGPTELTYESTHLLIDYLRDAARSLVSTDSDGGQ